MANEKVTSLDVAKRAGVSQSAVSRVFTPGASASKETIEKVRQAADRARLPAERAGPVADHRPQPDHRPRGRLSRQLLLPRGGRAAVGRAAGEGLPRPRLHGLADGRRRRAGAAGDPRLPGRRHRAGLGLDVLGPRRRNARPSASRSCSSTATRTIARLSSVTTDNLAGGRALADHLVALGQRAHRLHRRLRGRLDPARPRARASARASPRRAASSTPAGSATSSIRRRRRPRAACSTAPDRPDAVFVCNDHMAFAVMDVIRFELGLRIPEDVSVVGFDDVPPAAWPAYALTTLPPARQPHGRRDRDDADGRIEGGDSEPRRIRIDGSLIVRGSTVQTRKGRHSEGLRPQMAGRSRISSSASPRRSGKIARSRA